MKLSRSLLCAAAFAAVFTASCGAANKAPAPAAAQPQGVTPIGSAMFGVGAKDEGERLFGQECAFCHVGKTTGTMMLGRRLGKDQADLTRRTDLEADYVKAVVRNGLMNMPAFSRVELTDAELDRIAGWLARNKR